MMCFNPPRCRLSKRLLICWLGLCCTGIAPAVVQADTEPAGKPVSVAVASNFKTTMQLLADSYELSFNKAVTISAGSTGKHFAQIIHGAPFDVFFAADSERPARLEKDGHIVTGSRFTYAIGRLVLWSPDPELTGALPDLLAQPELGHPGFARLAIANPRLAPYGQAARQTLLSRGEWESVQPYLVRGENIAQTFQFVASKNVLLGFIAYSQLKILPKGERGAYWLVPAELHQPIEQQAVLLKDSPESRHFLAFIQSPSAISIIRRSGYDTP